jgi:hypothetical protein
MNVIDYFGPKVAKLKLIPSETQMLFEICEKSNEPYNHRLVGHIKEEIGIDELLRNSPLHNILLDKVEQYLTDIDSGSWKKVINSSPDFKLLELKSAWYNKQTHMEFNPIHDHRNSADLVCVIFPKIYLDDSVNSYYINYTNSKQRGQLTFVFGEHNRNDFGNPTITVQPEEGDMFIFPSTLRHYTAPVLGNSVRYSVSCNFKFSNLAHRLSGKLNSHED